MPRVSVIIPSYNHEKYIGQAIQSVLDQTYQDFEIVITDDGSTDDTVNEIKKFKDHSIRLFIFEKNQGASVAVAKCISEAQGEYIAILNSDDIFLPPKLEKQVRFLDEHPEVWAVFGYPQIIDEDGNDFTDVNYSYYNIFKQPNRTRFEWLNFFFYKWNCLCHPSVLARRDCYTKIGPPEPRFSQLGDLNHWVRLCMKHEIYIIQENLIKFRVRAGEANASGDRPEVIRRGAFEFIQILKNFLEIETTEEFSKIFPEATKYGYEILKDTIPFFVAMLALDNENSYPIPQYFAISVLFDLFRNKDTREKLEKRYGFRYIDFIKLAGKYDLFNVVEVINLKQKLIEKDQQLREKVWQLVETEKLVHTLSNSWSLRMTAPLRALVRFLKGNARRLIY